jgi:hypothetical protein
MRGIKKHSLTDLEFIIRRGEPCANRNHSYTISCLGGQQMDEAKCYPEVDRSSASLLDHPCVATLEKRRAWEKPR